jgi:hypothetical protein
MAPANSLGNNIIVLYGGEQGPFTDGPVISVRIPAAVVAADLDGDADKLTTNTEMSEPVVVLAADIDVDGNPGLVSTNYLTNDLTIFYRGTSAISCVLADVHLEPDCKDSLPSPS